MDSVIVRNFHINGEFDTIISGFAYSAHRIWHLRVNSEGANNANVHVDGKFNFTINSMVRYECTSIYMDGQGERQYNVPKRQYARQGLLSAEVTRQYLFGVVQLMT